MEKLKVRHQKYTYILCYDIGRLLCLFFFLIPFSFFAIIRNKALANDTLSFHASEQVYIAESTVIYNKDNHPVIAEKQESAKIYIVKGTIISGLQKTPDIQITYVESPVKETRRYAKKRPRLAKNPDVFLVSKKKITLPRSQENIHTKNNTHSLHQSFVYYNFPVSPFTNYIKGAYCISTDGIHTGYYYTIKNTTGYRNFSGYFISLTTSCIRPPPSS